MTTKWFISMLGAAAMAVSGAAFAQASTSPVWHSMTAPPTRSGTSPPRRSIRPPGAAEVGQHHDCRDENHERNLLEAGCKQGEGSMRFVVFRSAKERPFAERKATICRRQTGLAEQVEGMEKSRTGEASAAPVRATGNAIFGES